MIYLYYIHIVIIIWVKHGRKYILNYKGLFEMVKKDYATI